jgi:hypothetical protein
LEREDEKNLLSEWKGIKKKKKKKIEKNREKKAIEEEEKQWPSRISLHPIYIFKCACC